MSYQAAIEELNKQREFERDRSKLISNKIIEILQDQSVLKSDLVVDVACSLKEIHASTREVSKQISMLMIFDRINISDDLLVSIL